MWHEHKQLQYKAICAECQVTNVIIFQNEKEALWNFSLGEGDNKENWKGEQIEADTEEISNDENLVTKVCKQKAMGGIKDKVSSAVQQEYKVGIGI